jgi:hypothetical protein
MTTTVAHTLLGIARALLALANESRGSKEFGAMLKDFDQTYRRASLQDQSDYHRAWCAEMQTGA